MIVLDVTEWVFGFAKIRRNTKKGYGFKTILKCTM